MARRKAALKRVIIPDPIFGDYVLAKFVNCLMKNGKKSIAEKIVYGALRRVGERIDLNPPKKEVTEKSENEEGVSEEGSGAKSAPIKLSAIVKDFSHAGFRQIILGKFTDVLDAISPKVEVKSRRVGGATYQVPIEVQPRRRVALAMRWLIEAALGRSEKTMMLRLAGEILDALEGRGAAVKKREDMHRMAKANQAFAHYRY